MRKIRFEYPDGKKIDATIPESWEEVTVEQFINLGYSTKPKSLDLIHLLAVLTQIPVQELEIIEGNLEPILAASVLLESVPDLSKVEKSDILQWNGRKYRIPDIDKMSMAQMAYYAQHENDKYITAKVIAIVLTPKLYGSFDEAKSELLEKQILNSPFIPLKPAIDFFLNKRLNSLIYGLTVLK